MQAHLNRAVGDPKPAGDRLLGQVLVVAELDQLAVPLAEALERSLQLGALDRGDDPLVFDPFARLNRGDRVRANPRMLPKGLVADDRRQPVVAAGVVTQRRATAPGSQQCVLSYVLSLARVVGIAIGDA